MSWARLRGSAPTLAAILVVVALLCGFSLATTMYVDQQGTAGLRAELASRTGADLALRASLPLADDAERQADEVQSAIARTFASTGVSFETTRTLEADVRFVTHDQSGAAVAMTVPDFGTRVTFTTGAAPDSVGEVAVQDAAATSIGLEIGDDVSLNEVPFVVSGTWTAVDPLDPRWFGDDSVATGGTGTRGPFVITEEAWGQYSSVPSAIWTVVPESIDRFTATNMGQVTAAWAGAKKAWRGNVLGADLVVIRGPLVRTLNDFAGRIEGLRAIEPVAAVLVAGSALVVLSQLIQLLVAARERETALLWARGQSRAVLARGTAIEVAAAGVLGAALGVAGVTVALALTSDVRELAALRASAIIVPAVVVVGAVVFAAVSSYRSAVSVTTSSKGGRGDTRAGRVAIPGVVILLAIAAALSIWQLRLYGSPLTPNAEGSFSIDPIAVIAPALALAAVVLGALAAFPAVVGLYSKRTQNRGVIAHLSARTLTRQARRVAAPLVVVALAVGSATVGATFSATWGQLFDQTAALRAGADLRVSSPFDALSSDQLDAVAVSEGVEAIAPLNVQPLSLGTITGTTLAATPDAVRQLTTPAGSAFSPEDVASAIHVQAPGPQVPDGAGILTLRVEALNFVEAPAISAWIEDDLGRVREVTFDDPAAGADSVLTYTADLGSAQGAILSFDLDFARQSFEQTPAEFRLVDLVAGTGEQLALDQYWVADTLSLQLEPPFVDSDGRGFEVTSDLPSVRLTASFDGAATDAISPPVVVTERIATSLELQVGDLIVVSVRDVSEQVNATVTGIAPAIPGARSDLALLMDLSVINHFHQRAESTALESTDLWIVTDDPEQVRSTIRGLLPASTRFESSDDPVGRQVLGAASIALWAAALCCLLIALVAVAAASNSRLRWGRDDIASLRAIGLGSREQSRVIAREMYLVLAVAAIAGVVAGVLISVLTVPQLARAAVDRAFVSLETGLAIDWVGWAILTGALAVGVALVVADLGRRVRVLADTSLPSEGNE